MTACLARSSSPLSPPRSPAFAEIFLVARQMPPIGGLPCTSLVSADGGFDRRRLFGHPVSGRKNPFPGNGDRSERRPGSNTDFRRARPHQMSRQLCSGVLPTSNGFVIYNLDFDGSAPNAGGGIRRRDAISYAEAILRTTSSLPGSARNTSENGSPGSGIGVGVWDGADT